MEALRPLHFVLPLFAIVFVTTLLVSYFRQAGKGRWALQQDPITRLDYLLPCLIAAVFFCGALWRLGQPEEAIFDECYHSRSGMEYVLGLNPTEWTHPPLAKLLIAESLTTFGGSFNPKEGIYAPRMPFGPRAVVGWRFPSLVFGALTLIAVFGLARSLTGNRRVAVIATVLLMCDGVFFVQSRIAMTNIETVFFITVAAWTAWLYRQSRKPLWLLGLGLALGCAVATRWTTLAAVGMIAIWLLAQDLPRVWRQPRTLTVAGLGATLLIGSVLALRWFYSIDEQNSAATHRAVVAIGLQLAFSAVLYVGTFLVLHRQEETAQERRFLALPGWYLLALVVVPATFYLLTYIPYLRQGHDLVKVLHEQKAMWDYHAGMKEGHVYTSPWWSWPLLLRATWYYNAALNDGRFSGIWCIGNAFFWWASVPGLVAAAWLAIWHRRAELGLVAILGLGLWLVWGIQPRPLIFLHYYFEVLPFAAIALAYLGCLLWRDVDAEGRGLVRGYALLIVFWFIFYYPVLSALPIPNWYYNLHLWQPGRLWI